MTKATAVTERMSELGIDACIELLEAYGIQIAPALEVARRSDEAVLSGVIGFTGDGVRATCWFAANHGLLAASCPSGCKLRDWVGELANQFLGRLKMKLLSYGIDVALTTPLAFSGTQLAPWAGGDVTPKLFAADTGFVMVWLEVDAAEELAFRSVRPIAAESGEMLLF